MSIRMGAINNKSSVLSSSIKHAPIQTENTNEHREVYAKDDKKYKTHSITFPNFTLIDEAGADEIGIFEEVSKYYEKNTKEEKTPQEDKDKLNDTFKAILQKLKIDKDKNGKLEAGELAGLSLTAEKRKELSYMMVKHESEWEYAKEKFQPILDYLDQDPKQEKNKKMFEDRLEKLAFFPKDIVGEGKTPTFIHPIALVEGFVGGGKCTELTLDNLKNIDTHATLANREKHLEGLNNGMKLFEINTCLRVAHFLAQVLHESAHLSAVKELGGKTYLKKKSYYPYYGRGLMQLTWESNFKAYGDFVGVDTYTYIKNTDDTTCLDLLKKAPHSAQSACWFWTKFKKLNDEADKNDFFAITYKINGGFNGIDERFENLENFVKEFNLDFSTEYLFKDSWIYKSSKASLAWGIWHDPLIKSLGGNITGCTKDSAKAKEGYKRVTELISETSTNHNDYSLQKHDELNSYKDANKRIYRYKFAKKRMEEL